MRPILYDFPMPISTPRLLLRPPQLGDGIVVNQAILESFETLKKFMPWGREKPSVEDSEEFTRKAAANWILKDNAEPYLPIFIFDILSNEFIGAIGYHHYDWTVPCTETGYWIRNSLAGSGFMTEATNAITQYAFRQLGMRRIAITCDVDNLASQKIPKRLGFQQEALIKSNRVNVEGELSDTLLFARYNSDDLPELAVSW